MFSRIKAHVDRVIAATYKVDHVTSRWGARERLNLVSALSARPGTDSEALLAAHGLGDAYLNPSQGSSKKARINSALHAAQMRGDLDAVLDSMASLLDLSMAEIPQPAAAPTSDEAAAGRSPASEVMPSPRSDAQRHILQATWDLFYFTGRWPTFHAVDARVDQTYDLDLTTVAETLPTGLLLPPNLDFVSDEQTVQLTIAGAAGCVGSREEVDAFLTAIRLATSLERQPRTASTPAVLTADTLYSSGGLPVAGREDIVRRVGALLAAEPWGWASHHRPDPGGWHWTFTIRRDIRRLRDVESIDDYWTRIHPDLTRHAPRPEENPQPMSTSSTPARKTVFLVHGHDEARHEVARFLERAVRDAEVVILSEQQSRGLTVIEKFEQYGQAASCAVVLLTPDDLGRPAGGTEQPRARQNVVFELGYFVGKLGRDRVVVVNKGGVEKPSDLGGIVYITYPDGQWKVELARELSPHVAVDLNRA